MEFLDSVALNRLHIHAQSGLSASDSTSEISSDEGENAPLHDVETC